MSMQYKEIINIHKEVYDVIVISSAEGLPHETGGIVYYTRGDEKRIGTQAAVSITNVHSSPSHNYSGSASETLAVYDLLAEDDGEVVFTWHSHPTADCSPSEIDKRLHHPSRLLAIVSFANGEFKMKLWKVSNWEEVQWQVI
jgi:proteasome lid subunit RPN8/RPN11